MSHFIVAFEHQNNLKYIQLDEIGSTYHWYSLQSQFMREQHLLIVVLNFCVFSGMVKQGQVPAIEKPVPLGAPADDVSEGNHSIRASSPGVPGGPGLGPQFQQHGHGPPFLGPQRPPYQQMNHFRPPGNQPQHQSGPPFQQNMQPPPQHFPHRPQNGQFPPRPNNQHPGQFHNFPPQQYPNNANSQGQPPFPRPPFGHPQQYPPPQQFPFPPQHPGNHAEPSFQGPPPTTQQMPPHGGLPPPPFPLPQSQLHEGQFQGRPPLSQNDPGARVLPVENISGSQNSNSSQVNQPQQPHLTMNGSLESQTSHFPPLEQHQASLRDNFPPAMQGGRGGGPPTPAWAQGRPPPYVQVPPEMQSQPPWQQGFVGQSQGPPRQGYPHDSQGPDQQQRPKRQTGFHDAPNTSQLSQPYPNQSREKSVEQDKPREQQPRKRKSRWDPAPDEIPSADAVVQHTSESSVITGWPGPQQSQTQWNSGPGPGFSQNGHAFLDNRNGAGLAMEAAVQEAVLREQVFNCPLLAGWDSIFNARMIFHVTYVELLKI